MTNLITVVTILLGAFVVTRLLRPRGPEERLLLFFIASFTLIVALGYLLSGFNSLARPSAWFRAGLLSCGFLVISTLAVPSLRRTVWGRDRLRPSAGGIAREPWSGFERGLLSSLGAAALAGGVVNLVFVLFTTPYVWDNMAYRLTRVAFWLQQGRIGYFDTAHDSRVLIQRSFEIVLSFILTVSGGRDNLAGIVQYIAYWVGAAGVFGIGRRLGLRKSSALFSSLVYLLLVQVLLQASTANNDLVIAVFLAGAVYFLLAFRQDGKTRQLFLGAWSLGLAFATKLSVILALPSVALLAAFVFFRPGGADRSVRRRGAVIFPLLTLLAVILLAFPAGYIDNWRIFNHPFGTESFRKDNVVEGMSPEIIARNTLKHLSAYALDFLSLDGLPPVGTVRAAQRSLHSVPRAFLDLVGFSPETDPLDTWYYDKPWYYGKPPISHPDYSFWGVLGFALVWPAVFLSLLGRRRPPAARVLAGGALLFILVHSASGGSWGHYTIYAAVFAVPLAGFLFPPRRLLSRLYLATAAGLGVVTALTAVLFQYRNPLIFDQAIWLEGSIDPRWAELMPSPTRTDSVLARDRLGQLLRDAPQYEAPIRRFEELVPPGAVVAICLNPHTYEYPLFGEGLTRRLVALNSFWRGLQPIPPEAEYLLWADDFDEIFNRGEGDIHLGLDWWLRRL